MDLTLGTSRSNAFTANTCDMAVRLSTRGYGLQMLLLTDSYQLQSTCSPSQTSHACYSVPAVFCSSSREIEDLDEDEERLIHESPIKRASKIVRGERKKIFSQLVISRNLGT